MNLRTYNPDKDLESLRRVWREIGWTDDDGTKGMEIAGEAARTRIAEVDGAAECFVMTMPSDLRYVDRDLPMSCVTGVGTSRVARRQGLAGRLTAKSIAEDVADGAILATLGIFDQGFYNRLGFGNGAHIRRTRFDPATLKVEPARRVPCRLTFDDWEEMHRNRLARRRGHGSCSVLAGGLTHAEFHWTSKSFGLGFRDGKNGELSHHILMGPQGDPEHGPYDVRWMAYNTGEQLLELLGLIKNLGDQVHGVRMPDPPGVQLQILLDTPFKHQRLTKESKFEVNITTLSYVQFRICDLAKCLEHTKLPGDELRFNLQLTDPIETWLPEDAPWRGVAGEYIITLGVSSGAERGHDDALSTMRASVNAFTRLWLGVGPATGLAITDDLDAPRELLEQLEQTIRLPIPLPDWDY